VASVRVLGLDIGARRIGLALSDPEGRIAFPEGHLDRRGPRRDMEALRALIAEREVGTIVVGLPLHLDGRSGAAAQSARDFAVRIGEATGLPVELIDERWTTVEAERHLRSSGRRTVERHGRGTVDAVAATLLLSAYLARRRALAESGDPA